MSQVHVENLLHDLAPSLKLEILAGQQGIRNRITHPRIQKHGLALAGFLEFIHPQRVQVLGKTEVSYLRTLSAAQKRERLGKFCELPIACFVVTSSLTVPEELLEFAEQFKIPVLRTPVESSECIAALGNYLERKLAPQTSIHGVLMDIYGVGVLLLGKSGSGKSESALHLVSKGHRLVADDIVEVRKIRGELIGQGGDLLKHNMEIRGLGIINVKDLFGVAAIQDSKTIDLVIQLESEADPQDEERLGLDEEKYEILEVSLPYLRTPVRPGRNIPTIIEVAARTHLLKLMGYHSAQEVDKKLMAQLLEPRNDPRPED
ncbi:MAG TPA: HPr(Ser) kinase/phosphatase [bacterium]|nr:HPr(Ser) kinase/phosphatase [bacterium]